jgi:hypothetical protein
VVSLTLDEWEILGDIAARLENRLQWDLIFTGEFFGRERIRARGLPRRQPLPEFVDP